LNGPVNETTLSKPSQINLTITDINLEIAEWKANVTQTIWTNSFNGTFDINLTQFSTNQAVQFWIRANDTANNSNIISIILAFDDQPPTKPPSPSFSFQAGGIMLSWSASSDQSMICYQIWRNGEYIGNTTSTSYLDTDSLPPREYIYQIIPIDEANNIGEANTITVIISGQASLLFDPITIMLLIVILIGALGGGGSVILILRRKQKTLKTKEKTLKKSVKTKKIQSLDLSEITLLILTLVKLFSPFLKTGKLTRETEKSKPSKKISPKLKIEKITPVPADKEQKLEIKKETAERSELNKQQDDALKVLKMRLVRGEITEKEFKRLKKLLLD